MIKSLSEIAQVTMGQSPKSEFYNSNNNGLPFLQGRTTFGDKYPTFDTWTTSWNKEAFSGDILFTVRAPVGDLNIANCKIAIGRGLAAIHPTNVNNKYLYYLLLSNKSKFVNTSSGTIFDSINKNALESIKLNVHDSTIQNHIVNTIGTIDDLIENMQKQNDKIDKILTKYFSNLSASDHRLITDICDIKYGKGFVASKLDYNYKYPVYGGNGIIGTSKDYMFNIPKIAISCRGAASGNVILTKAYSSISSNSLYLDLFNNDSLLPLFYYLKKANLTSFTTGSAQPQITIENINKLHIPDSLEYNIKLNNYLKVMDLNSNKINTLKKIKETLLSKYF